MNIQDIKQTKLLEIANQLKDLTFNEQLALVSILEKECGYVMPVLGSSNTEEENESSKIEQQTAFKVILNKIPEDVPTKFQLAKFLSSVMGLDLVGARNVLSKLPFTVKENLTSDEAKKLVEDLTKISEQIVVEKL